LLIYLLKTKPTLGNNVFLKRKYISTPLPSLQTKKEDITLKRYFWGKKKRVVGLQKGEAIFFFL